MQTELPATTAVVPFDDVASFTRKLIHDVRNGLNALDLQLTSLLETTDVADAPLRDDLMLARRILHTEARRLVMLAAQLRGPSPQIITYRASDLVEDMQARIVRDLGSNAPQIDWSVEVTTQNVPVDFEILSGVVVELVRNATQFREGDAPMKARGGVEDGKFLIELRQKRTASADDPESWGIHPFRSAKRGAYGLGLFAARRALAALGGSLRFGHDAEQCELSSRLTLPLAP